MGVIGQAKAVSFERGGMRGIGAPPGLLGGKVNQGAPRGGNEWGWPGWDVGRERPGGGWKRQTVAGKPQLSGNRLSWARPF
jgi:hypothetical protein